MKVVDANVLIYAVDSGSEQHLVSRDWLNRALSGHNAVGFTWGTMLAFMRISTHRSIFSNPLTVTQAGEQLADWVSAPGAVVLEPAPMHLHTLMKLLEASGTAGNLAHDAHIAAIALEHGADVVSYDRDFDRFPELRWQPPRAG